MRLTNGQLKTSSSFFNDVAKAVTIASILGQGFITEVPLITGVYIAIFWISISTTMFLLAMMLSRNIK